MDIFTLKLAFRKAKKYIDSFVIPQGAISVPVPRDQLAQDVRDSLAKADDEPGLRHREIQEAIQVEAEARQREVEELNGEIRKTNESLGQPNEAIWGKAATDEIPAKQGLLNGPGGEGLVPALGKRVSALEGADTSGERFALRSDGFLLRLSLPGIVNIPPGTAADLLASAVLPSSVTLSANTDLGEWGLSGAALVFPAYEFYTDYNISVRLSGDAGGGGVQPREFTVQLVRQILGTVAAKSATVKVANTDLEANAFNFMTFTNTLADPFIDGGVRFVLSNTSGEQITLSQIDIVIKGTRH